MQRLGTKIMSLIVCFIIIYGYVHAEKAAQPLRKSCSYDSILELSRRVSIKIRSEIDAKFIGADAFDGLPPGCYQPMHRGRRQFDLLSRKYKPADYGINEGIVYNSDLPGKYYPLFSFNRLRIIDRTDSTAFEFSDDTWETLLGYAGLSIFDNTDQRRHIQDSLALEEQRPCPAIKK